MGEIDPTEDWTAGKRRTTANTAGSRLDSFVLEETLGEGAFGVVFRATDTVAQREVAIKMLKPSDVTRNAKQILLNEARKAARLTHDNIASIYHVVLNDEGVCYIVMQYIDGKDLAAIIQTEGPLPSEAAAKVVLDVASGLAHAHANGIFHLDVKPSNILVTRSGKAVLVDFGMAVDDSERWTCGARGSVAYMAPEQIRRESPQFDGRTDLWALGIVLYEMLTKQRPFTGGGGAGNRQNLMEEICSVHPKPPSQWNPSVPASFDDICLKCLQKDIGQRYASATHFKYAVSAAVTHERTKTLQNISADDPHGEAVPEDAPMTKRRTIVAGCLLMAAVAVALVLMAIGIASPHDFKRILKTLLRAL